MLTQRTTTGRPWSLVRPPDWLADVKARIDGSFRDSNTVRELAASVGVHRDYLSARFSEEFGVRILAYVRLRRVAWAARALTEPVSRPREVAEAAGFFDQSHFFRSFSSLLGIGPQAFQRILSTQAERLAASDRSMEGDVRRFRDGRIVARGCALPTRDTEARGQSRKALPLTPTVPRSITIEVGARAVPRASQRFPAPGGSVLARVSSIDSRAPFAAELDLEHGILEFVDHGRLDATWRWYPGSEPMHPTRSDAPEVRCDEFDRA